ncbi:MAG: 30S ribosomal protein S5 [Chloroherpetonaceae bacterium]|nr:30S ribosomal protein S5 [Chloroherpetonaceae bacterium]
MARINPDTLNLETRPIRTNKCQKTTKGGRTLSWSALVIVGDRNGHVGCGIGKARAIPDAIRKGEEAAKKNLIAVPIVGGTIPHELVVTEGAAEVMLKPASPGTGIVAGSSMRTILELAGIHDVLGKSLGSSNAANIAWATMKALRQLKRIEDVAHLRAKPVEELTPWVRKLQETTHVG